MMSNYLFLVEDYIENKRFPEKMQFFQEYPIRSQTGEIFSQPGMVEYTVELKSDDIVHFKEGFNLRKYSDKTSDHCSMSSVYRISQPDIFPTRITV